MVLFVGDKPSPNMKPGAKPFEGAACENRLLMWQRFLVPEYFAPVFQQERDKGYIQVLGLFTYNSQTEEDLKDIRSIAGCKAKVVALGNAASKRLTAMGIMHFKLPHPSGRNRQLNDKEFIASKLNECKEYLKNF